MSANQGLHIRVKVGATWGGIGIDGWDGITGGFGE